MGLEIVKSFSAPASPATTRLGPVWLEPNSYVELKEKNKTKQMNIGEEEKKEKEREANHKRLLTAENKLRVDGRRWAKDGLKG